MPIPVWLPRWLAPWAERLLARSLRTSRRLSLGNFTPSLRYPYPALSTLGSHTRFAARYNWNRARLPLYGLQASGIPARRVVVPGSIIFEWDNPDAVWPVAPQITVAQPRARGLYRAAGLPLPPWELLASFPDISGSRRPPEWSRRRFDSKVPQAYAQLLSFINRTYGRASEYWDAISAIYPNLGNPLAMATALALNEAVDRAYGARAHFLKQKVYSQPYYTLPVGLDVISRFWR